MTKNKYGIDTHVDPDGNIRVVVSTPAHVSREIATVIGSAPASVEARISLNRELRPLRVVTTVDLGDGTREHMLREEPPSPSD